MIILVPLFQEYMKVAFNDSSFLGRLVFINLKKAIQYTLTHLVAEAIPYILFVIIPIPLTMTSTQILTIDLGFDLLFTLSFGWEPAEDPTRVLKATPRMPITYDTAIMNYTKNQESHETRKILRTNELSAGESTAILNDSYENLNPKQYEVNESQRAKLRKYWREAKRFFSDKKYWTSFGSSVKHIVTTATEERLVDSRVLSWAYLEGGTIECLGGLCTFFTVLWVEFGISPTLARKGQILGGIHWKPHSPDLIAEDGTPIVIF
jgi:sodium/potassium-transporting ATPase subunit alpha